MMVECWEKKLMEMLQMALHIEGMIQSQRLTPKMYDFYSSNKPLDQFSFIPLKVNKILSGQLRGYQRYRILAHVCSSSEESKNWRSHCLSAQADLNQHFPGEFCRTFDSSGMGGGGWGWGGGIKKFWAKQFKK